MEEINKLLKIGLPKIIFLILGMIIIGEIGFAVWVLTRPVTKVSSTPLPKIEESAGRLILTAEKKIYKVNDVIKVTIGQAGSKSVRGTDIVIKYDPKVLEATSGAFEKGTSYKEYSNLLVDSRLGTIQISGFTAVNERAVSGTGVFGTLNFKAKQVLKTQLTLDFTPGLTTDSNIVDAKSNQDILEKGFNLDLEIQ